jgi:hypothetical protein
MTDARDEGATLRRRAAPAAGLAHGGSPGDVAPAIVHDTLRSGGAPLPAEVSARMGRRFGHDFSRVLVHADARAEASADAVGARAYTVGHHIVFARGELAPATPSGERLLAHELAHTVQQDGSGSVLQRQIAVGGSDDPEEAAADHMAEAALRGDPAVVGAPAQAMSSPLRLRRQLAPQRRRDPARAATVEQPNRGDDQVHVHVRRYLCDCVGRDVTREQTRTLSRPDLGVTYQFCRGRATVSFTGRIVPGSTGTGSASAGVDVNISPQNGGAGARFGIGLLGRNTGTEPQLGGTADLRLRIPGAPDLGLGFEALRGLQTGQIDTQLRGGIDLGNHLTLGVTGTNLQDQRRGGALVFGGDLPGQAVEDRICRVCRCPVVYDCIEDVPPRDYTEQVPDTVTDSRTLRYYFKLDTTETVTPRINPDLASESRHTLDEAARLVGDGWTIASIWGYASPEALEREHNEPLSEHRATQLQNLLVARLGSAATVPQGIPGGELLGRTPSAAPDSQLADAIRSSGFSSPEEMTGFLFGDEIPNEQLAAQFLQLLSATAPERRTSLFGVPADSPLALRLTAAIDQFIARRGRGPRPWEAIFQYLRVATVELTHPRAIMRPEARRTQGSVRTLPRTECERIAADAESEGRFGPAEPDPSRDNCSPGDAHNDAEFGPRCDYST